MTYVIIFSVKRNKINSVENKRKSSSLFETLTDHYICDGIKEVVLKWIDSVKFKDKIIRREPRVVKALMFEKYNKLLVFSESESEIQYFGMKIEERYDVSLTEIHLYERTNTNFLITNKDKIKVIAFNMKGQFNEDILLNASDIEGEFNSILNENEEQVISITFLLGKDNYFTMDKNSVISIPDNISEDEVIELYEGLFKLYA